MENSLLSRVFYCCQDLKIALEEGQLDIEELPPFESQILMRSNNSYPPLLVVNYCPFCGTKIEIH